MIDAGVPTNRHDRSSLNRTEAALIARQVDTKTAHDLRMKRWTLGKLKQLSDPKLAALGLSDASISDLRDDRRPEIPPANLARVFAASRFSCCICHNPAKPIIVHHIRPWAQSRDHSASNLALLCQDHHEHAHRTSTLSRNLDPPTLTRLKNEWEQKVRVMDARAILEASRLYYDAWWYFNHRRLFELAQQIGVPLPKLASESGVGRLVTADGVLKARPSDMECIYTGMEGLSLYGYVRTVMDAVLEGIAVYNISDVLDHF